MPNQTPMEMLLRFAEHIGYDPEQSCFVIGDESNYDYFYHETMRDIKKIIENYDSTGTIALLLAKRAFLSVIEDQKVSVADIITGKYDPRADREIYEMFTSDEVNSAIDGFTKMITTVLNAVLDTPLLGEADNIEDELLDYLDDVLTGLDKCRFDVYKKSDRPMGDITHVGTTLLVYPSVSSCITDLVNAEDGLYYAFIDVSRTPDSHFAIAVKSNGNLVVISDRIAEQYRGAHARSRSGRWTDGKADTLFPYDYMLDYEGRDCKGYATRYELDDSELSFYKLGTEVYMPFLLAAFLVSRKLSGNALDDAPTMIVDALLPGNVARTNAALIEAANDDAETAIAKIEPTNAIVKQHEDVNISFNIDTLLSGGYEDEFHDESAHYSERMTSQNQGQIFIDLYGEGFVYDPDELFAIPDVALLPSADKELAEESNDVTFAEFIGTEKKIRLQGYYEIRRQLAEYVKEKMNEEYEVFGGRKAIHEWYVNLVSENKDKLEKMCADTWNHDEETGEGTFGCMRISEQDYISSFYDTSGVIANDEMIDKWRNIPADDRFHTKCAYIFTFAPKTWMDIEETFGCDVPKIVKGWQLDGHRCAGNTILDTTDACEAIGTPFEDCSFGSTSRYHFRVEMGFSKRGLKAMLRERGEND